jgi:hypothetical protein
LDRKADTDTARTMAGTMYHEAFDLDFQLRNIFAAAEIEAGETTVVAALVDVTALVRGLTAAFDHKAAEKGVTAVFEPGEEPLMFKTDPDKLRKRWPTFSPTQSSSTGRARRSPSARGVRARLIISITDEGFGIPERNHKKVFDRFVQLDTVIRKRRGRGSERRAPALGPLARIFAMISEQGENAHYLVAGTLFAHEKRYMVTTVLGSCVSVCLWDGILNRVGINHYMLPFWKGDGLASPK